MGDAAACGRGGRVVSPHRGLGQRPGVGRPLPDAGGDLPPLDRLFADHRGALPEPTGPAFLRAALPSSGAGPDRAPGRRPDADHARVPRRRRAGDAAADGAQGPARGVPGGQRPDRRGVLPVQRPGRLAARKGLTVPTDAMSSESSRGNASWRLAIVHETVVEYTGAARASYNELRMTPLSTPSQVTLNSYVELQPRASMWQYTDYWGTRVTAFDLQEPHSTLTSRAGSLVETKSAARPAAVRAQIDWPAVARHVALGHLAE